jgi:hypothetical protein
VEFCQRWHSFIGLGPNFLSFQVFRSQNPTITLPLGFG